MPCSFLAHSNISTAVWRTCVGSATDFETLTKTQTEEVLQPGVFAPTWCCHQQLPRVFCCVPTDLPQGNEWKVHQGKQIYPPEHSLWVPALFSPIKSAYKFPP